jgi:NADH-quinone oxidoreductase subunit C
VAEESNPQPGGSDREELKGLSQANLELLSLAEELLDEFHPQAGTLSDLPQITVEPADTLQVCRIAKDHPRLGLKQLECLACVDYQDTFQLVYFLHSLEPDHTLAIKTNVPYDSPVLPSVTSVWQAADWYEREAHDLFGVVFNGHPSLAPLLLYEGFEGYPGRKEFPFHDYQEF